MNESTLKQHQEEECNDCANFKERTGYRGYCPKHLAESVSRPSILDQHQKETEKLLGKEFPTIYTGYPEGGFPAKLLSFIHTIEKELYEKAYREGLIEGSRTKKKCGHEECECLCHQGTQGITCNCGKTKHG